jgi:hypothetical protein
MGTGFKGTSSQQRGGSASDRWDNLLHNWLDGTPFPLAILFAGDSRWRSGSETLGKNAVRYTHVLFPDSGGRIAAGLVAIWFYKYNFPDRIIGLNMGWENYRKFDMAIH